MPTERCGPGVAALDNKIYVTGGHHPNCPSPTMSSVDCYDPDTNTWSQVANMNIARQNHSLVSLQGKLYAIGGNSGENIIIRCKSFNEYVDSAEVYDPDNNTWTLLEHNLDGKMDWTRAGHIKEYYLMSEAEN